MPLGPPQQYIVTYNGYQLPGYAQSENDPNELTVADHYAFGWDGSMTQLVGLVNKQLSMEFLVWEPTYRACKDEYHKATTILRTRRDGFAPLYVDYDDRYLNAVVQSVTYQQEASASKRILRYQVAFETEPWWLGVDELEITGGTGTLDTDAVSRTFDDGGWSPIYADISGTDVTISGYSDTERFTGYVSVSGTVANFIVDTSLSSSFFDDGTGDKYMRWADYGIWVAPGKTSWVVTGASAVSLKYHNRWY